MKTAIVSGLGFLFGGLHLVGNTIADVSANVEGMLVHKVDPSKSVASVVKARRVSTAVIQRRACDGVARVVDRLDSGLSVVKAKVSQVSSLSLVKGDMSQEEHAVSHASS